MPHIIEFPLPASTDDPHWQAYSRLGHAYNHELFGTTEWDESPEDGLVQAAADTAYTTRRYLASVDGTAVGYARSSVNHVDDPDAAFLNVYVHPGHRGRGHGRALAERLVQDTAGLGRFETWPMLRPPLPGQRTLTPSSGAGAVPAGHPGVRLARSYGF
ncbi:GNAT family N-acetyltransferase [Micrococcus luteus]|uniref:GNAT family N-acetyltransferase n=1 Tax=Micrococcus luteus TaxID=1270 RepID=UPI00214DD47A|nr:GNAT family N-acetyltransferase [Micrococcus luteus]